MRYVDGVVCMCTPELSAQKRVHLFLEEIEVHFAVALRDGRATSISITARGVPVVLPHVADADASVAHFALRLHISAEAEKVSIST